VGIAYIRGAMDLEVFPPRRSGKPSPLVIVNKEGLLWMIDDPDSPSEPRLLGDIGHLICTTGSRGFMSIVPYPDFANTKWVYLYYVAVDPSGTCPEYDLENGPRNTVARIKMRSGDYTLRMNTLQVLITMTPAARDLHVGGDMLFGADGNLWITVGEGGTQQNAQMLNELQGSLLRITPDGGIPPDNPFTAAAGYNNTARCNTGNRLDLDSICQEIWATGLRSPYRFAQDLNVQDRVKIFFSDVGGNLFEEINEAGTDMPKANYGWPALEGPCDKKAGANNLNCTPGVTEAEGAVLPHHWYRRLPGGDAAAVGGAFVPTGIWPAEYEGSYVFSDYTMDTIYHLWEDQDAGCLECGRPPTQNATFLEGNKICCLTFAPYRDTQALYYASRDASNDFTVRRVSHEEGENRPPVCILETNTDGFVNPGDPIRFSARASFDPDDDRLRLQWDYGDGATAKTNHRRTTHTYANTGTYSVVLTISDRQGGLCNVGMEIHIGGPPTVSILSPAAGTTFAVGDVFPLIAEAYDQAGNALDDTRLSWEMNRHHNTHYHPWLAPTVGNGLFSNPAPPPEDIPSVLTSYLEILVTATDDDGLTATATVNVQPSVVNIELQVEPASLEGTIDFSLTDYVLPPPVTVPMWENGAATLEAPEIFGYTFVSWSDGGAQQHVIIIDTVTTVYRAVYEEVTTI